MGHHHQHHHGQTGAVSAEQQITMLAYMLDHNRHHAADLHDMAHRLKDGGAQKTAALLERALEQYHTGNDLLEQALQSLKGGD